MLCRTFPGSVSVFHKAHRQSFSFWLCHAENGTGYSVEEAVKEGAVIQEENPELIVNGENTVEVRGIDEFKGHGSSAPHGV